jgi:hypothetical protein
MKTSNKLLLGFLSLILAGIVVFGIFARVNLDRGTIKGNGKTSTVSRNLPSFTKVHTKGRLTVFLSQGGNTQLKINADENLIPLVKSEVENGELELRLTKKIGSGEKVEVYLTADSNLNEIEIEGRSQLETPSEISGDKLTVKTTAGGRGKLQVKYRELFNESHAGGNLTLLGVSNIATFIFTSGGVLNAEELTVDEAKAEGSSGALAHINVKKELDIEVSSGANLSYKGNARIGDIQQSSGGSVSRRE